MPSCRRERSASSSRRSARSRVVEVKRALGHVSFWPELMAL
jgi:hypothetical protein